MAGRPFRRALIQRIKEKGGYSVLLARIADGQTMVSIAPDYACSPTYLRTLLKSNPKLRDLYNDARRDAAQSLAEKGLHILDSAPETRDGMTKAKARAEYTKWLAQVYDRETFGDSIQQQSLTNFGDLYLQVLKSPALPNKSLPASGTDALPVKEALLISEESSSGKS